MSKKLTISSLTILLCSVYVVVFAGEGSKPCSAPEASQFDFWLGMWDLTWDDTLTGSNVITKELDSCVIHENFNSPSDNFNGQSFSAYNAKKGLWEQTWVDNLGNFMYFTGGFKDNKMTLSRSFTDSEGNTILQRMVYFNISDDSLDWSRESSEDGGQNWKQNWLIHYKRANK